MESQDGSRSRSSGSRNSHCAVEVHDSLETIGRTVYSMPWWWVSKEERKERRIWPKIWPRAPGLLSTNSHMTRLPCEAAWCEALGSGWIYSVLQHFIWIIYLKRDPYDPIETIDTSQSSCITFIDKVSKARICVIGKRRQALSRSGRHLN